MRAGISFYLFMALTSVCRTVHGSLKKKHSKNIESNEGMKEGKEEMRREDGQMADPQIPKHT